MQWDVTSGPAARLRGTEALLPQLDGLTGIDGRAVYLHQIRVNPSLALRCSGTNEPEIFSAASSA